MKKILIKTTAPFCVLIAALFAFCPLQSRADTVALSFAPSSPNTISGSFTFGWSFSLSAPILLTNLGVWDGFTSSGNGDGLAESHILTVWDSAGTQLVQTTISAGGSGTIIDDFRYVSVAPTLLLAGNYVIGNYTA